MKVHVKNEKKIKSWRPLDESLADPSMGSHVAQSGVYIPSPSNRFHRIKFYGFLVLNILFVIRPMIVILLPGELTWPQRQFLTLIGDASIQQNFRYEISIALAYFTGSLLVYDWIHFRASRPDQPQEIRQIQQQQISPFFLLQGLAPPRKFRIRDPTLIERLIKQSSRYKKWHTIITMQCFYFTPLSWLAVWIQSWYVDSHYHHPVFLVAAFVNYILIAIYNYSWAATTFYHMMYFGIICYYLKLKLHQVNLDVEHILNSVKNKNLLQNRIPTMNKDVQMFQSELYWYNRFWSKILFILLSSFSLTVGLLVHASLFAEMNPFTRGITASITQIHISAFLVVLYYASSVNESRKSLYLRMNSLWLKAVVSKRKQTIPLSQRIKV